MTIILTTTLHKVKETKRFVAYEADEDAEPVLGTTYVHLEAVERLGNPETLVVTVSAG